MNDVGVVKLRKNAKSLKSVDSRKLHPVKISAIRVLYSGCTEVKLAHL